MGPERKPLISNVPVKRIEITVQSVDIQNICGLERNAVECNDHHQRS